MSKSVIIDAGRSPVGIKNGQMIGIRPEDLAAQIVTKLLERNNSISADMIEDVVVGCAFPEGPQGMNIGKFALNELIIRNPRKRYLANVSPNNKKSMEFFKNNKFKLIQYTFQLDDS